MRRSPSPLSRWMAERAVADEGAVETSQALYADYVAWCDANDAGRPMSSRAFGDALRDRHVMLAGKTRGGLKLRRGLRLTARPQSETRRPTAGEALLRATRRLLSAFRRPLRANGAILRLHHQRWVSWNGQVWARGSASPWPAATEPRPEPKKGPGR